MAVPRGGAYGWPSRGNTGMAKLLGNPGILGQGGIWLSQGEGHTAGHPGVIPGWPSYLGIPGYLDKGGIWLSQGERHTAGHPGVIPGWPSYLGIPGYLDKGGIWPGFYTEGGSPGISPPPA